MRLTWREAEANGKTIGVHDREQCVLHAQRPEQVILKNFCQRRAF
jgi:hypothetical protein